MSSERRFKVILHGYFKELYPHDIYMSGESVAEVINGVCKQTKAFNVGPEQERHCLSVVGFNSRESLFLPIPANVTELHLVPDMTGGKSGGFFRIIIGVVLIASVIATGGATSGALAIGLWGTTTLAGLMINIGISLILGGLIEMMSPAPKIDRTGDSASDPEASKYLGASGNTVRIGTRISLLYGERKAYGHYISFDVDAKDIAL